MREYFTSGSVGGPGEQSLGSTRKAGDQHASEELLPLVYDELRKLAAARMANERPDHTLQATALVHEAYVRLVDAETVRNWDSRGHFFAAAAEAMRRILVDAARRKQQLKAGGDRQRKVMPGDIAMTPSIDAYELLALDEALRRLEAVDPQTAQVVRLKFFAGLSMPEVADLVQRPLRTVEREWTYARLWLKQDLAADSTPTS
jgi:RNA polymerase sigma factor (TIGR02999 family)